MTFKCLDNCSECCGVVPIPKDLWDKHKNKARIVEHFIEDKGDQTIFNFDKDFKCSFLVKGKCIIYEDRPKICKDYGLIEGLPCPLIKPNGNKRSEAQKKHILRQKTKEFREFTNKIEAKRKTYDL